MAKNLYSVCNSTKWSSETLPGFLWNGCRSALDVHSQLGHVHFLPAWVSHVLTIRNFLKVVPLLPKHRFCAQDPRLCKANAEGNTSILCVQLLSSERFAWLTSLRYHSKSVNFPFLSLSRPHYREKHRFSSDHRSKALSGEFSTSTFDRLWIPRVIGYSFWFSFFFVFCFLAFVEITNFSLPFSIELCFMSPKNIYGQS